MSFFSDLCKDLNLHVSAKSRKSAFTSLSKIYGDVEKEWTLVCGTCKACGRCCHFEEYGHTLFVTPLEVDYLKSAGQSPHPENSDATRCPYQDGKICAVRNIRPLCCRVFYCDTEKTDERSEIAGRYCRQVRQLNNDACYKDVYAPFGDVYTGLSGAG